VRAAVVVPTNRPERIKAFCAAWEPQLHCENVRLIVVEDGPGCTAGIVPNWAQHLSWDPDARECFPRQTGACRDFGFFAAGQDKSIDMVVSLDDDVLPMAGMDLLFEHWQALTQPRTPRWQQTAPFATRGLPYGVRCAGTTAMNHGLWAGTPDLDAFQQLSCADSEWTPKLGDFPSVLVALGTYIPVCSMNLAMRREHTRFFWMPVLPDGYKRWDDIWAGIVFKRLADLYGWGVTTGLPLVRHERASNVVANLRQEMLGYGINERLWQVVDSWQMRAEDPMSTFVSIWSTISYNFPQLGPVDANARAWARLWEAV